MPPKAVHGDRVNHPPMDSAKDARYVKRFGTARVGGIDSSPSAIESDHMTYTSSVPEPHGPEPSRLDRVLRTRVIGGASWERRVVREPGPFIALLESAGAPSDFLKEAQKQIDLAQIAIGSTAPSWLPSGPRPVAKWLKDRYAEAQFRAWWEATGESDSPSEDKIVEVP